jgi:hypothetical protein
MANMNLSETICKVIKEIVVEMITEKTRYMFMSRYQFSGQNHSIKTGSTAWETWEGNRYIFWKQSAEENIWT